MNYKKVICTWSGGIDSTAVLANLLKRGYHVKAVTLNFYDSLFIRREKEARDLLVPTLDTIAIVNGGRLEIIEREADWIWAFSNDHIEIPRRNKHIMDHIIVRDMMPNNIYNLAMGEYVGADSWLVQDHVGASDADHRALEAYLYLEYGIKYRLISLRDFGESRFKSDRLKIGWDVIGDAMNLTTNCLRNSAVDCGLCYKCVERHAAFAILGKKDKTFYVKADPSEHHSFHKYIEQMQGKPVSGSFKEFKHD